MLLRHFFVMPQLESEFSDHTYSFYGVFGPDIVMSVASIHNDLFFPQGSRGWRGNKCL